MKRQHTPLLTLLFLMISLLAAGQKVTVYSNDFNGSSAELGIGRYDYMSLIRMGVSTVRSVKVPAGMQVTLYEKDNFGGTTVVLLQDANRKLIEGKGFGQLVQNISLVVAKAPEAALNEPTITIFKDNFSGASLNLRAGYYDHYELGLVDNDHLSSVKVPKGLKATLYEHGGYTGRSLVITEDVNADFLVRNNFNDITSSIRVEVLPAPPQEVPVVKETPPAPKVEVPQPVVEEDIVDPALLRATIFEDDYRGAYKKLGIGKYNTPDMGIADNTLSSVRVPEGLKITLYEQPNFKGESMTFQNENASSFHLAELNNAVSSIIVEVVPRATLYHDNFTGHSHALEPGHYNLGDLEIGNDELSSVKVMPGLWVLLFEHNNFEGRTLLLTKDASKDFLAGKEFDEMASSVIVGATTTPLPIVTLYNGDRDESFKTLTPGSYPLLDAGNNQLSSIDFPRGMRVKLFEDAEFGGRQLEITKSAGTEFLQKNQFDNITSSVIVELIDPRELVVTVYTDSYSGFAQELPPGKYYARDLIMGARQISSVRVPRGMQAQLFANSDFTGTTVIVDHDTDYSDSKRFDNYFSSVIVRDIQLPAVIPVPSTEPPVTPPVVEQPVVEKIVEREPPARVEYSYDPPCTMTDDEFKVALKAIEAKTFSDEKAETAMLVTKGKCLTNAQIRAVARQFGFEEEMMKFIKQAYDKAVEKETYYQLEDVFMFSSSKEELRKFLLSK